MPLLKLKKKTKRIRAWIILNKNKTVALCDDGFGTPMITFYKRKADLRYDQTLIPCEIIYKV